MSPAATAASTTSAKTADLKLSTSARPGSRMAIEIAVPANRTQSSHNEAVEKLSRSVRLPGFRQGKVPRAVLLQQIGPQRIRATALKSRLTACSAIP
jgi:trigger factor